MAWVIILLLFASLALGFGFETLLFAVGRFFLTVAFGSALQLEARIPSPNSRCAFCQRHPPLGILLDRLPTTGGSLAPRAP